MADQEHHPSGRKKAAATDPPERRPQPAEPRTDPPASTPPPTRRRMRAISRRPDGAEILGGIPDAVTSYDENWRYVYVNAAAAALIGRPAGELLGRPVAEIRPNEPGSLAAREFRRAMVEKCPLVFEDYSATLGRWFEHRLFPSPHGLTVWSRDVSDRRAAESERARLHQALAESEERFRALIEKSHDGIVVSDASGTVLYASPSAARIGGWASNETTGRSFVDTIHPDDRQRLRADRRQLLSTPGAVVAGSYRFPNPDGAWLWIEMVEQNLLDHPGVRAIVTNFRDVTDRKNAERNLETLLEIAREMGETLDLQVLLDRVQRHTAAALGCDVVVALRWNEDSGLFRVESHFGCPEELVADLSALTFRPFEPFGGRLAEGAVVVDEETEQDERVALLRAHFGLSAMVVAPLRLRGRQLGAIAVAQRTPGLRFAPWQVELCSGIARQLAVALERTETHRIDQEVAAVASALATLGRELLSSFDQPGLLERTCELTTAAIGCTACVTFLWQPASEAFVAVASHGVSAARAEEIRLIGTPRAAIPDLLRRLASEEVVGQVDLTPAERLAVPSRLQPMAGTVMLFLALRRGGEVVGFQVATQRPAAPPFSAAQIRIARGAAQLVSMALEHARVLQQLEQANHLKSDFVAMMSHELRTPLHVILGYGDLLLDGAFGDLGKEALDALAGMRRSSRGLLQLVDEMLDLNRLEGGRIQVQLTEVSPGALLAEIELYCADLGRQPEVALRIACDPDLGPILTDAAKVGVVLKNLIGNALKFTSSGEVAVTAAAHEGGLALTVRDTGIGIAPEQQPFIFEPFRQGDSTMTRRHGGVGLGLYIVQRMVDALGGTITVDSEPGRGSTFRAWVPDARRSLPDEHARFQSLLADADGEAAIVDNDGTIVAVNDRWLRFAQEQRTRQTDRLGVGVNYFEVCAHVRDDDADTALAVSDGLRALLDGERDHFVLEYTCVAPRGHWSYRMEASPIGGTARYALVSHTRLDAAGRAPELR